MKLLLLNESIRVLYPRISGSIFRARSDHVGSRRRSAQMPTYSAYADNEWAARARQQANLDFYWAYDEDWYTELKRREL